MYQEGEYTLHVLLGAATCLAFYFNEGLCVRYHAIMCGSCNFYSCVSKSKLTWFLIGKEGEYFFLKTISLLFLSIPCCPYICLDDSFSAAGLALKCLAMIPVKWLFSPYIGFSASLRAVAYTALGKYEIFQCINQEESRKLSVFFFLLGCPRCTQWLTSGSICPNRLLLVVFRGPFVVLVPGIEPRWVATNISPLSPVLSFWPDIIRFVFASSEDEVAWSVSNFILKVNCVFL